MESEIILIQKNGLRAMVKSLNCLKLQITQLENQVRELRIKLAGGIKNERKIN